MNAVEISRTGLDVEWQRLQVIAQNLANMNTTRAGGGEAYRAMRLLSGPQTNFARLMSTSAPTALKGVKVLGLQPTNDGVRRVYEPSHPDADGAGFVTYPAIDQASEMTLLLKTSRVYSANLMAMSVAQQMYARALDLGKQA
ncbi:MAG: flagellar basal body rod protein FlgC [Sphingomonas sp.]|nr:flagellar basal body rod protein FlgC [Sphingomonas sp.]